MAPTLATATYHDARVTQAERLCYELIADGEAAHPGARSLNHVAVTGAADGRVTLTDRLTGRPVTVVPRIVVNAAGPWIDRVMGSVGLNKRYMGGTKGSHLVVDDPDLVRALDGHMIYFGSADGRICLVYPFFGRALIGSTDIKADEPDTVACTDAETDYMLAMVGEVFPGLDLSRDKIVYRYAGIRPLPAADVDDPGEISRDHSIGRDRLPGSAVPMLSLVGGKWTTFRAFAAQVTDEVLAELGQARRVSTEAVPIGGGRDFPAAPADRAAWIERVARQQAIDPLRADVLLDRYGSGAEALLTSRVLPDPPLASLPDYGRAEVSAVIRHEQVVDLEDLLFRRLPVAVSGRLTQAVVAEVAGIAAEMLGWSDAERDRQIGRLEARAERSHGVSLGGTPLPDLATPPVPVP